MKSNESKTFHESLSRWIQRTPKSIEQLQNMLKKCHKEHLIDRDTIRMIEGVLDVSSQQVRDVMVPRAQMVVLESEQRIIDALPIIVQTKHSRFPVIGHHKDEIKGILLAKELLNHLDHLDTKTVGDLCRWIIPESKRLDDLVQEFQKQHHHMGIVVDEYGEILRIDYH